MTDTHKFTHNGAATIKELLSRHWHLTSVGLGNCRMAQEIRRELNEQLLIQSAALANANFNTNELRDSRGRWTTNATGTATNRSSQTNKPPANPTNKPRVPTKKTGTSRIAGIVYNETSGIYPALKPGAQPGGPANWDSASRDALNEARERIAEVAHAGKKKVASPVTPNQKNRTPAEQAQWQDSSDAATRAEGKQSNNNFVIWPSDDGKTPSEKPRMQKEDWPYDYKKNITAVYGPFRVPIKVGDVPAGSNIYIFFYKDVP